MVPEPGDVARDGGAADLDAAMVATGDGEDVELAGWRILEVAHDLGIQAAPVGLDGEQMVGLLRPSSSAGGWTTTRCGRTRPTAA